MDFNTVTMGSFLTFQIYLQLLLTCSIVCSATVTESPEDCSWLWTIVKVNPTKSEVANSSYILKARRMDSNDDEVRNNNNETQSQSEKEYKYSHNGGRHHNVPHSIMNCSYEKGLEMLMVYKPPGCVSILQHWSVQNHENDTAMLHLSVIYSLYPTTVTPHSYVGSELHSFHPAENPELYSFIKAVSNKNYTDLLLFPIPPLSGNHNYLHALLELENEEANMIHTRFTIPVKRYSEDKNVIMSSLGIHPDPVHSVCHSASISTCSVLVMNGKQGLLATTCDEFHTQSIHQVDRFTQSVCNSETLLHSAKLIFHRVVLLATKYGLLESAVDKFNLILIHSECYTKVVTHEMFYPAKKSYAILITEEGKASLINTETKKQRQVSTKGHGRVLDATIHPQMTKVLLLSSASDDDLYYVTEYVISVQDIKLVHTYVIPHEAKLCSMDEIEDNLYLLFEEGNNEPSQSCGYERITLDLTLTSIWYLSDFSGRFYVAGNYIMFSDLSHQSMFVINQKLSSPVTSFTHLPSDKLILLLTNDHQIYISEPETAHLSHVDISDLLTEPRNLHLVPYSLFTEYSCRPDTQTPLLVKSLFVDSQGDLKLAVVLSDSFDSANLTWLTVSRYRLLEFRGNSEEHYRNHEECPLQKYHIISSNAEEYGQSQSYKWRDGDCILSQDHQTDELVKLWAYEQEMASTGHNDVKLLGDSDDGFYDDEALVSRSSQRHEGLESGYIYLDRGDIYTFTIAVVFHKKFDSVKLSDEMRLSVSASNSDLIDIEIAVVQHMLYNISVSHHHLSSEESSYSLPGDRLKPVTATVKLHLPYQYKCSWQDKKKVSLLLGCPPNLRIIPDIGRMQRAVITEKGTELTCSSHGLGEDNSLPCLHFRNGFHPHFLIWNKATNTAKPYRGNYTLEIVGAGRTEDQIIMFTKNELFIYNRYLMEKAQGFNRILTTKVDKTSKYDVTEDGLIIWNDATIPLSWVCHQYSPCGNVAPLTLFGIPEYTFLFRFSNLDIDRSTECNLTYLFRVKLYGIPYSSLNSILMTLATVVILGVGSILMALCWRRIDLMMLGVIDSVVGKAHQIRHCNEEESKKRQLEEYRKQFEHVSKVFKATSDGHTHSEPAVPGDAGVRGESDIAGLTVLISRCSLVKNRRRTRLAACSCDRRPHVLPDKLCPIHYQQHTDHCEKFYINTQVLSKTPPAAAGKKH